jgi:hypothetical protein
MENALQALIERIEELEDQVAALTATEAVRRLQHQYGYYLDKCLYDEVVDLFSDQGEVRFLGGVFKGKESVRRLYCGRFRANFTGGKNGPVFGFLLDHPQLQDVIHIAADRTTAQARFRSLMQAGRHESSGQPVRQWWEGGLYENTYVREDGVWKIKVLNYRPIWHADFETGWAHTRPEYVPLYSKTYPEDPIGPDELESPRPSLWPDTGLVPFHYPHPVTGRSIE